MAIDKSWALNCIRHNRNSCILTLAGISLLNSDAVQQLKDCIVVLRPGELVVNATQNDRVGKRMEIPLSQVATTCSNEHHKFMADIEEHWKHARRNLVKECFEVAKAYSAASNQEPLFKAQDWYPYARVIRNCISHDLHFQFTRHDLQTLPVRYLDVEIGAELQGTLMLQSHLEPFVAFSLVDAIARFVFEH